MHPPTPKKPAPSGWRERITALRNVPPLLRMVWETSASLSLAVVFLRIVAALLPVAMLYVAKLIIDLVVADAANNARSGRPRLVAARDGGGASGAQRRNRPCHRSVRQPARGPLYEPHQSPDDGPCRALGSGFL